MGVPRPTPGLGRFLRDEGAASPTPSALLSTSLCSRALVAKDLVRAATPAAAPNPDAVAPMPDPAAPNLTELAERLGTNARPKAESESLVCAWEGVLPSWLSGPPPPPRAVPNGKKASPKLSRMQASSSSSET